MPPSRSTAPDDQPSGYPPGMSPFRPARRSSLLARLAPLAADLGAVTPSTLRRDAQAGLTVAAVAIPSGIAYAQLAGLPAVRGLYALLLPAVVYAVTGSSRHLVIGPEGALSAMVASAVIPLTADAGRRGGLAALLALLVAAAFLTARALRLGWIADYLSRPVLVGYIHGIAIVLIIAQLGKLSGLAIQARQPLAQVAEFTRKVGGASLVTTALGVGCLGLLLALRRWPRLPGALLVVIGSTIAAAALDLDLHGVALLGRIPSGLPGVAVPPIGFGDIAALAPAAVGIFLVGMSDEILTARSFAGDHGGHVRANQELLAVGLANAAAAVTRGFPIGASGSRTAVNAGSGARSQLSGLVSVAAVGLVVVFLTDPIRYLSDAALGAVIVSAAVGMVDPAAWAALARASRAELLIAAATVAGVVVIGVLPAIGLAVALSLIDTVRRSARPHDAVLGWVERLGRYADVSLHPSAVITPGVLVYRLDDRLFFANSRYVRGRIEEAVAGAPAPVQTLVFDAEALAHIDVTGAEMLDRLVTTLASRRITLRVARLKGPAHRKFGEIGLLDRIGGEHTHPTVRAAVAAAATPPNGG